MAPVATVLESLESAGVSFTLYDRVRVEPTDESFLDAIAFAKQAPVGQTPYDAFVAGRRRIHHRHREGRQPVHQLPAG